MMIKKCEKCETEFEAYSKWGEKRFCSKGCSNSRGPRSEAFKASVSSSLKGRTRKRSPCYDYTQIKRTTCVVCDNSFWYSSPKGIYKFRCTCSDECYLKSKRKNAKGIKSHEYSGISLDSNWEVIVAQKLDELHIEWIRPSEAIDWIDKNNKQRKYFPDFFLPKYNLYLDPKNRYCVEQQQEKLDIVSKSISLVYGDLDHILEHLAGVEPTSFQLPLTTFVA